MTLQELDIPRLMRAAAWNWNFYEFCRRAGLQPNDDEDSEEMALFGDFKVAAAAIGRLDGIFTKLVLDFDEFMETKR